MCGARLSRMGYPMCGARPSRMGSRVTPCVAHGRAGWVPALLHVWRTAEQAGLPRSPMCGARLSRLGYPITDPWLSVDAR
ncbi:hypothetical protein NDU88_000433 [Pleurodeles waltl]|uniref:Uncharacterized protein n=1 Tax=Pleurodeles waltl TaxID=8319 RepID=A0AAV7MHI6_PLEWA|nr:hypothetical protein NDU88_000433 [Pleurodeles waltl]